MVPLNVTRDVTPAGRAALSRSWTCVAVAFAGMVTVAVRGPPVRSNDPVTPFAHPAERAKVRTSTMESPSMMEAEIVKSLDALLSAKVKFRVAAAVAVGDCRAQEPAPEIVKPLAAPPPCLLYTSDAADERSSVDLGGRRIIK